MWDLDFIPELWDPPTSLVDPELPRRGVPNHGIGRAMKVGKEEIVGLLAALARFRAGSDEDDCTRLGAAAVEIQQALSDLPHTGVTLVARAGLWPIVRISIASEARRSAIEIARELESGSPPIYLATGDAAAGHLAIDPFCLQPGESAVLVARLREVPQR